MARPLRSFLASCVVLCLIIVPVAAAVAVVTVRADSVGYVAAGLLGLLATLTVIKVLRSRSPYRRTRSSVARRLDNLFDYSFAGAGSLRGWSSFNPASSLSDLRGEEAPFVSAVAVAAQTTQPVPKVGSAPLRQGTFEEYVVARGDTFWSLAERFLGSGNRWSDLHQINIGRSVAPGVVLGDDDSLVPGWKIAIPASGNGGVT